MRLILKTLLTLPLLGILLFPGIVGAQVATDNCKPDFTATPNGVNCSCEPKYANSGSCENVPGGSVNNNCSPGYVPSVPNTNSNGCSCVLTDQTGSCTAVRCGGECQVGPSCSNSACAPANVNTPNGVRCVCVNKNTPPGSGVTVITPQPAAPANTGAKSTTSGSGNALDFSKIAGFAGVRLPGSLGEIVSKFLPFILGLAGIILFFFLIWGGFSWMMAKGDPKATASAREKITKAIVGFAIIFTAYWLAQILGKMFGISQFQGVF